MAKFRGVSILALSAAAVTLLATTAPLEAVVRWDLAMLTMGWARTSQAADTVMFARRASDRDGFRRVWARYEYLDHRSTPYGRYRSETVLYEVDCRQGRSRVLQTFRYAGQNLSGAVVDSSSSSWPKWTYSQPGTLGSVLSGVVCRASAPATS